MDLAMDTWITYGEGPTGTAIRDGVTMVVKDFNDPAYLPWKAKAQKRGYNSSITLPLFVNGETFGALCIKTP